MNSRERLVSYVLNKPVDRGIFFSESPWSETLARWQREGMPEDYNFDYDFDEHWSRNCLGINIGPQPPFEETVLKDEGDKKLIQDKNGIIMRVLKEGTSMPQFVSFPVRDRKTWDEMKKRLDPDLSGRFPNNWKERVEKLRWSSTPIATPQSHLDGFFGFLRELCGDNIYYMFYDDPDLIRDMLDFQVYRLTVLIKKITRDISVDIQYIWEDMCYNSGPLISPEQFRDFLLEPYQKVIEVSKQCGIPVIDMDSDGNMNKLLPLWVEAGVNMMHPFEVAAGMDVVEVKQKYGNQFCIRGGIDKREIAKGFKYIDKEIERVRPAFELGGYIPSFDHKVSADIAWDNMQYYLEKKAEMVGKI